MGLSQDQVRRYGRQLLLPEFGVRGQERLLRASALLIGMGGLGSPAALYLAAAGVGRLGLLDSEPVEAGNLHRQVLHDTQAIGRSKVDSAQARLRALNPAIEVVALRERLEASNALRVLESYDLVLDGSDNMPTRYLANDACVLLGKPLVHGAAIRLQGQVLTILPRRSACLRCVFPEPPQAGELPSCQAEGVLGSVTGLIGALMAHEALKLLGGFGTPLADRLLTFDGIASGWREVPVRRDPQCAVCGDHVQTSDIRRIVHAAAAV
ncbi:MAG: HesA/MoeB/ThiF family protein [Candidatus Omnitrophica bacterium]|nr:HesA/MoeB/ThiF family protein [Candidatus Omnitrophota bacterium]